MKEDHATNERNNEMNTAGTKKKTRTRMKDLDEQQRQKLRSAVLMSFVSVLLISGATFAWFTVGNTVRVKSLSLQVAAEGKLIISDTEAGLSKKDTELELNMGDKKILYPCTTKDGKTFLKPVYESDTVVKEATAFTSEDKKEEFYYEKELWLEVVETVTGVSAKTYDITLAKKGEGDADKMGSYVAQGASTSSHPEYCIRISFETPDGKVAVYEPNSDGKLSGTEGKDYAKNEAGSADTLMNAAGAYVHNQTLAGTFAEETGNTYYTGDSSALFSMEANKPTKVIMRVWFEGTDPECQNAIEAENIVGQIKFVSHNQADASKNK